MPTQISALSDRDPGNRRTRILGALCLARAAVLVVLSGCQSTSGPVQSFQGLYSANVVPGLLREEAGAFRRQTWLIPSGDPQLSMVTTIWRPKGKGPFPLVVINHASSQGVEDRIDDPTTRYETIAMWFAQHGYAAAVPIRPGHGDTGGPYLEDEGPCDAPDYARSGAATAVNIKAVIDYLRLQTFIRPDHIVIVGQSAGGWGALALAADNPPGVGAIVIFAGGRGGHAGGVPNINCAPDRLIATAAQFGSTARIPALWIYARNDSFFGPDLSTSMAEAFRSSGGQVEFRLLPAFGDEGHFMIRYREAIPLWSPLISRFLARVVPLSG